MVRLLQFSQFVNVGWGEMFQSHNGAIAACPIRQHLRCYDTVSIPQWCDCCVTMTDKMVRLDVVSIPQWCDCCHQQLAAVDHRDQGFNPTMVRLLLARYDVSRFDAVSFNPTMVRLLQGKRFCISERER